MLYAIDQYAQWTDRAALSMDSTVGRAAPSVNEFGAGRTDWHGPSCTFYRCFNCPCALGGGMGNGELHAWIWQGIRKIRSLDSVCICSFYFHLS